MRTAKFPIAVVLAVFFVVGCGEMNKKKTPMDMKDVPADILKVAKEKLPDVNFESAWKVSNGCIELQGNDASGKHREIEIRSDGTVEEIE